MPVAHGPGETEFTRILYLAHSKANDRVICIKAALVAPYKQAKFIAVFGNNEGEKLYLKETIEEFGGEIHEYCYKGRIGGRDIYMTHIQHSVGEIAASQQYDLLVYGHTHKQDIRTVGKTLIVNPGECTDWLTGLGMVVILDLKDMSYRVVTVC